MRCLRLLFGFLLFASAVAVRGQEPWEAAQGVLHQHCTKCHGGVKHKGGLDLRAVETILRGGDAGPAVIAGDPDASLLVAVLDPDSDTRMPPKGKPLTKVEKERIRDWIESLSAVVKTERLDVPSEMSAVTAIDFFIAKRWAEQSVQPSMPVNDAEFLRRTSLILLGRIPTPSERRAFLAETRSSKRSALVEQLLGHPEFARHFAEVFDAIFLGRRHGLTGRARALKRGDDWHRYWHRVFQQNRPWNVVARELLGSTRGEDAEGAQWYLAAHRDDHEALVRSLAPTLLGKQIACAQCHNHPLVPEIEQRHYWGLVAFFTRSFNVETPQGLRVGERAVGGDLKFSTLEGGSHPATLAFFSGDVSEPTETLSDTPELYHVPPSAAYFDNLEKRPDNDAKKKRKDTVKMDAAPVPQFSRREAFAEVAIEAYPDFAKAMVNRLWAMVFGRGLVHPVDHLDSVHPPSHPELLEWLGDHFAASGYDVHAFVRTLMATKAYALSSLPAGGKRPPAESFACWLVTPMGAETLYRSMLVAGGRVPDAQGRFEGMDDERFRHAFARVYPDLFPEIYSPQVGEGLFFSNNAMLEEIIVPAGGRGSSTDTVEAAFQQVHGRSPDTEEREAAEAFLGSSEELSRQRALLWALITSAEFRFIH